MKARYARAVLIVGALAAGGAVAAVAGGGSSPAAAIGATAGQALSTGLLASQTIATTPATTSPGIAGPWSRGPMSGEGRGEFGRGFGRFGGGLTVTGVNGNTITATGRGGQTVTIQVSATTAYTEAGSSAALSDVHTGSVIAVRGSFANTTGTTITATGVTIVLPTAFGVVTAVNGSSFTLTGFNGVTHTVNVSGSTRYQKAGQSAALSDIATGSAVVVEGTLNGDGSLAAVRVTIQVPRLGGQISAVNGSSYTMTGRFGATYTVNTTSSTTYVNADGTTATATALKTGAYVIAEGSLSSDGKTLTAQRVTIVPAGQGRGFGHHGRRGFGGIGGPGRFGFGGAGGGVQGTTPGTAPGTTAPSSV